MARDKSRVGIRFGKNLRAARRAAAFSQEAVAARSGLHRTEISLLERGERLPRIDTLMRLAGSIDVPPEQLLAGIKWKPDELVRGGFVGEDDEG